MSMKRTFLGCLVLNATEKPSWIVLFLLTLRYFNKYLMFLRDGIQNDFMKFVPIYQEHI